MEGQKKVKEQSEPRVKSGRGMGTLFTRGAWLVGNRLIVCLQLRWSVQPREVCTLSKVTQQSWERVARRQLRCGWGRLAKEAWASQLVVSPMSICLPVPPLLGASSSPGRGSGYHHPFFPHLFRPRSDSKWRWVSWKSSCWILELGGDALNTFVFIYFGL